MELENEFKIIKYIELDFYFTLHFVKMFRLIVYTSIIFSYRNMFHEFGNEQMKDNHVWCCCWR